MSTTYYVNAATGSDANKGTSASTPLQSLAAVESLKLQPGDTVLFARGTSYSGTLDVKYSGAVGNPIAFGAFGDGAAPVIDGGAAGIHGSKTQNIVIQDLTISHATGNAISATGAVNWTVQNVNLIGNGTEAFSGAISFQNGTNITIKGSTITGGTGDGIWISGGKNIVIEQNHIGTLQGSVADNIQVTGASNVAVQNNWLDMSGPTNSTKGNLVVNTSDGVAVEHNTMVGGSYGASVNSNNVVIADNEVFGQSGYSWSFGIGIGENWDVANYRINDNYVHDVAFGVAITGSGTTPLTRTNIDIDGNTFDNNSGAALKVDRPASGEFSGNAISDNTTPTRIPDTISAAGTFAVGTDNTTFVSTAPHANTDTLLVGMHSVAPHGNLLANDVSLSGDPLHVTEFAGKAMTGGFGVEGKYGAVSVDQYGNFVYTVDEKAMQNVDHQVSETFKYLVTDGQHETDSTVTVDLMPRHELAPVAVNDGAYVNSSGVVSGNVLTDDHDANNDVLHVRSVDTTKVGAGAPVNVVGTYGTLSIAADGTYSYKVDPSKLDPSHSALNDNFNYKISDSMLQDTGSLTIHIDVPSLMPSPAADFHM